MDVVIFKSNFTAVIKNFINVYVNHFLRDVYAIEEYEFYYMFM